MNTCFKSALNRIEADPELVKRTESYLQDALITGQQPIGRNRESRLPWLFFPGWSSLRSLTTAACIAIFLIAGSTGAYTYYQTPASFISVDINPSVELGINAFGRVVSVQAYNADGRIILTGLELRGLKVDKAISLILASAAEGGYIADDGSTIVSITAETDESGLAASLESDALAGACESLDASSKTAVLISDSVSLSMREEAESAGITPGKLNLINKLQAVDPEASVDEYKDASVKEIIRDTQAAQGQDKKDPGPSSEYPGDKNQNDESQNVQDQNNQGRDNQAGINKHEDEGEVRTDNPGHSGDQDKPGNQGKSGNNTNASNGHGSRN